MEESLVVQGDSPCPVFRDKQQPGTCSQALAPLMWGSQPQSLVLPPPASPEVQLPLTLFCALLGDPELFWVASASIWPQLRSRFSPEVAKSSQKTTERGKIAQVKGQKVSQNRFQA